MPEPRPRISAHAVRVLRTRQEIRGLLQPSEDSEGQGSRRDVGPLPFRRGRKSRRLVVFERTGGIPRYWRRVDDGRTSLPGQTLVEEWMAVLAARGLPFRLAGRRRLRLYVPALLAPLACQELSAVAAERERRNAPLPPEPPVHGNAHWVLLFLILLILWHGVRMGWGPLGSLSDMLGIAGPDGWSRLGELDVYRTVSLHEWWRVLTALTLHADSLHLFGNVLFGAPFLILVCRRLGLGIGLLFIVLAGALGNIATAWYRDPGQISLGFSTAMFGSVGILSGFLAMEGRMAPEQRTLSWRRGILLLAAGTGVLAMLGTEGERTDYAAHVFGLLAGFGTGGLVAWLYNRWGEPSRRAQILAGLLAAMLLGWAWWRALQG